MSQARRAKVDLTWQSKDIGQFIEPYLLGLSYTDNLSGAVDDLSIELEDRFGLWEGDWQPTRGDTAVATLTADPWFTTVNELRLGTFAHDKITMKGPPRVVSLQCVSAPLATGLRRRKRTRAWRGVSLKQIAQDIADRAGLKLLYDGDEGRKYASRNQVDKSDLEFLDELCKEVGRVCKVSDGQIVVFDEFTRDAEPSTGTIDLDGPGVLGWNFDADDSDRYGSCHISFSDPRTGKVQKGEFVDPNNPDGQTLELRMPLESIAEAQDRAKALLRNSNRFGTNGTLTLVGDPGIVAGVTFDLAGAHNLNGKFIITKAGHKPVGGYTVEVEIRRCLEAY